MNTLVAPLAINDFTRLLQCKAARKALEEEVTGLPVHDEYLLKRALDSEIESLRLRIHVGLEMAEEESERFQKRFRDEGKT